jgi:hypothetical protein
VGAPKQLQAVHAPKLRPVLALRLKRAVKDLAVNTRSLARSAETSRGALLALAELLDRAQRRPGRGPLSSYELRVFSQNGEDGVLDELLRRAGSTGAGFVEFGAGSGAENNCALLADVHGWPGLFIEADAAAHGRLSRKYGPRDDVRTPRAHVTPKNIEQLLAEHDVPAEFDVLSIDIDGPDYWVWKAIRRFAPRIVVIEFNSALEPGRRLVQPHDRNDPWDRTTYFGASLEAMASLGEQKGYRLVHLELTGTNAFFVCADLPGEYPEADAVLRRGPNQFLLSGAHVPDPANRPFVDLDGDD